MNETGYTGTGYSWIFSTFLFAGIIVILLVFLLSTSASYFDFKQQAIEHGYAQYDSQTGEWGWKELIK